MFRQAWRWLLSPPDPEKGMGSIIAWWEIRRLPYNAVLGVFGVISLALFYTLITLSGELAPGEDAVEPLALIAVPFVANVLYTGGWIVHIVLRVAGLSSRRTGPGLWLAGTAFSLLIAAAPTLSWGVILLVDRLKHAPPTTALSTFLGFTCLITGTLRIIAEGRA